MINVNNKRLGLECTEQYWKNQRFGLFLVNFGLPGGDPIMLLRAEAQGVTGAYHTKNVFLF